MSSTRTPSLEARPASSGRAGRAGRLDLEKVLVIALHQQPPAQDDTIRDTLQKLIEIYRDRMSRRSGEHGFRLVPDSPGLRFYSPVTSLLWGPYDHATVYLADDLESVVHVASSSGATAQEFIFGSPYVFPSDDPLGPAGLTHLLGEARAGERPLLSINRIKLPDYLLSLGASALRAAMAQQVQDLARTRDVVPVILRCWSWPELAVVLLADRPGPMIETVRAIEETTVGDLRRAHAGFDRALACAVGGSPSDRDGGEDGGDDGDPVGLRIARLWIDGPPGTGRGLDAERVLAHLDARHTVVAAKSQLGILETSWPTLSQDLPDPLRRVGERAFHPALDHSAPETGSSDPGEELRVYLDALARSTTRSTAQSTTRPAAAPEEPPAPLDDPLGDPLGDAAEPGPPSALSSELSDDVDFIARISILLKPGHLKAVRWYLEQVAATLRRDVAVRTSVDGEGTTLLLLVRVADDSHAFARLLTISHWLRVWEPLRPHIVDVTTLIEEARPPESSVETDEPPQEPSDALDAPNRSGYSLLHKLPSDEARAFGRYRAKLNGLGRVESRSLHAWIAAMSHTVARPEMYGSMLELHSAAREIYSDLIYEPSRTVPDHRRLSDDVRELLRLGRTAYGQRLQYSPALQGAPPISGQLPYGINQIVGMLDGLAASIMAAARSRAVGEPGDRRPPRTIVVFEPDVAIRTGQILGSTVLKVNLLQALCPLSLCLLFHELGHVVEMDLLSAEAPASPSRPSGHARWSSALRRAAHSMSWYYLELFPATEDRAAPKTKGATDRHRREVAWRMVNFLGDVFPHAVWRRLGCGGEWDLFATQFLAGQAMGLRTRSEPADGARSLDTWTETTIHLLLQRRLAEQREDTDRVQEWLATAPDDELFAALDRVLLEVMPYAATELEDAAAQLVDRGIVPSAAHLSHLEKALRANCRSWLSLLALHDQNRAPVAAECWHQIGRFLEHLELLETRVERAERRLAESDRYQQITERIRAGEPAYADWQVLSAAHCHPTDEAFLWARRILRAVTESFRQAHRGGIRLESFRQRALHAEGPQPPERLPEGLYTDHTGGLMAVGRARRLEYLRVSNAAFESLWELASRIMAGRIERFLLQRRDFRRIDGAGQARLRLGRTGDGAPTEPVEVRAPLRDYCAIGFSVGPDPRLEALAAGEPIEIQRTDGVWLPGRVVWTGAAGPGTLGAVLESPEEDDQRRTPTLISRRLQMDLHWVRSD